MHHALANEKGYGYILTTDSADAPPMGGCDVYGEPGLLVKETLEVDEGFWDGQIASGRFVVNVCLPLDLHVGSKIEFEVADGTEICLTREEEAE
jgi:hypothetical protein